jgi:hypothetical protein
MTDITQNKLCILQYTTTDGKMIGVKPEWFDSKIVSHTYTNVGRIIFEKPITKICKGALSWCVSLVNITIPESVTTIESDTFFCCSRLTNITIPNTVTTIGNGVFIGCRSLKEFKGKFASADGYCLIVDGELKSFAIGCGVTEYTIPDSVQTIGAWSFSWCDSLMYINIHNNVTRIGRKAFHGCISLTSVNMSNEITTLDENVFITPCKTI